MATLPIIYPPPSPPFSPPTPPFPPPSSPSLPPSSPFPPSSPPFPSTTLHSLQLPSSSPPPPPSSSSPSMPPSPLLVDESFIESEISIVGQMVCYLAAWLYLQAGTSREATNIVLKSLKLILRYALEFFHCFSLHLVIQQHFLHLIFHTTFALLSNISILSLFLFVRHYVPNVVHSIRWTMFLIYAPGGALPKAAASARSP
ncbi:hypothetical protein E1B28_013872 [Marasmius oreades]|uniref:Uncharacterized protein n=1 Tax=Marasmius oreades TaxID=181124 RepID=A0A9P7RK18_9AGAR|nr:uncharacterized protein E1B28_013872 [Marasmius oreades]KAG7085287.1 hypothetical protein E1B28_013872 [Marasmius oreades]